MARSLSSSILDNQEVSGVRHLDNETRHETDSRQEFGMVEREIFPDLRAASVIRKDPGPPIGELGDPHNASKPLVRVHMLGLLHKRR